MPIEFSCRCGAVLRVPDRYAGQRARCPVCALELSVPAARPAPEEAFEVVEEEPPVLPVRPRAVRLEVADDDPPEPKRARARWDDAKEDDDDRPRPRRRRPAPRDEDDEPLPRLRTPDHNAEAKRQARKLLRTADRKAREEERERRRASGGGDWQFSYSLFFGIMYGPIPVGLILFCIFALLFGTTRK